MSYDTDHVRNAERTSGAIIGLPTFTEVLDNPALASIYTSIRQATTITAPELIDTASVSKKTVYDYLHKLEQAGLITNVGDESGSAVYTAKEFELTLTVGETAVSITPELIEVVAHEKEYPAIDRVLENHGVVTFALVYDLVNAHSDGNVTTRQIAELADISTGTAYDLVEALYSVLDLGDDGAPTTYTPADFGDESDLLEEFNNE